MHEICVLDTGDDTLLTLRLQRLDLAEARSVFERNRSHSHDTLSFNERNLNLSALPVPHIRITGLWCGLRLVSCTNISATTPISLRNRPAFTQGEYTVSHIFEASDVLADW